MGLIFKYSDYTILQSWEFQKMLQAGYPEIKATQNTHKLGPKHLHFQQYDPQPFKC